MDRPLRIAVVHSILHFGSTETYLRHLLQEAEPERVEWWLVVPENEVLAPLRDALAPERVIALPATAYTSAPRAFLALRRVLRRITPDLVHVGDVDPPAILAAASVRHPVVVTHHTPELLPSYNTAGSLLRRLSWAVRPTVIFTSQEDRETALRREPISRARTTVVPLGIDLERFAQRPGDGRVRELLAVPDDRPLVGTVGLLKEQKAHDVLIAAAVDVDATFVVAGAGPLRAQLERLVRERGLAERFFFLGHRDDVPEVLADLDVFALSSDFEGMCLAVAEALAVGTPVVATSVGGVPQTVVDGETGLLVPPRAPRALAAAITRLLDDRPLAARLASAGGERVRRLYALDEMVRATLNVYERLAR